MPSLPPSVRIRISTQPTENGRSFDGLALLVREAIGEDPFSGHLFVFRNRAGGRVKVLFWNRSGSCLRYERLEKGVFRFPDASGRSVEIETADLSLVFEGIELKGAKRRERITFGAR